MTNSKRIQDNLINLCGSGLQMVNGTRWHKVYRAAPESDIFVFESGYEFNPADSREEYTDINTVETEMRNLANLRHWTPCQY